MRKPFEGMFNILLFNWPLYAVALLLVLALTIGAFIIPFPTWLTILLRVGASGTVYFLVVSLAVSHIIYDRSPLYRWTWIKDLFLTEPQQIANIHAGFDESSEALHSVFPHANLMILDLYDPRRMTEPSIARARRYRPPTQSTIPSNLETLPVPEGTCDAIFLLFAAHELRKAQERFRLFCEVRRIAAPGGTILLVEHRRDLANLLAFGPGFLHFYPQAEWLRLTVASGLQVVTTFSMTPFVGVFVLSKGGHPYEAELRREGAGEQSPPSMGAASL